MHVNILSEILCNVKKETTNFFLFIILVEVIQLKHITGNTSTCCLR